MQVMNKLITAQIKYLILLTILVLSVFIIVQPEINFAQAQEYSEDGSGGFVPCGNTADNPCNISHLFRAFVVIVNYMITMAGFVAVVALVYAGFMVVVSQGEDKLVEAKKRFSGAIFGLVLVASAFVLVNTLFDGSMSIGVKNGAKILSSPLDYIRQGPPDPAPTGP